MSENIPREVLYALSVVKYGPRRPRFVLWIYVDRVLSYRLCVCVCVCVRVSVCLSVCDVCVLWLNA